jgi:hypothetical protein
MATDTEVSVVSAQIPSQVAGKNIIINGGFDVWQRNTSFTGITAGNTYVADRWTTGTAGSYNIYVSRQPTGDTVNLPNIQYCLRFGRTSGTSGANWNTLNTSLETANSIPFAGKTITLSFYARAGANFSSSGSTLASFLLSGTGVDQNVAVSYTGQLYSYGGHTLTANWQRFTNTYTVPTNATELSISLQYVPTGTAGANDYYEVTGVQLEASSAPTPFSRAGGDVQGELAKCQRYYQVPPTAIFLHGYNSSAAGFWWQPPVVMRTAPSASLATTSPYWESVPYTTLGSLTSASLNNTKMTASGGTIIIAGAYSPSPATSYPSLFNGSNIAFSAEL